MQTTAECGLAPIDGDRVGRKKLTVNVIRKRLEQAEEVVVLDLPSWALLCHLLLPEAYGDPDRTPEQSCDARPGSQDRIATLQARAARGEALFRDGDRTDVPDEVGLLTWTGGNGSLCPSLVDDKPAPPPKELVLQGLNRDELPSGSIAGCRPRAPRMGTLRSANGWGNLQASQVREGRLSELGENS